MLTSITLPITMSPNAAEYLHRPEVGINRCSLYLCMCSAVSGLNQALQIDTEKHATFCIDKLY